MTSNHQILLLQFVDCKITYWELKVHETKLCDCVNVKVSNNNFVLNAALYSNERYAGERMRPRGESLFYFIHRRIEHWMRDTDSVDTQPFL